MPRLFSRGSWAEAHRLTEVLRRETARVLWFPVPRRHVVEITGGRHIRVASWQELTVLRVDDDGMTVRDGDSVVRYAFTS